MVPLYSTKKLMAASVHLILWLRLADYERPPFMLKRLPKLDKPKSKKAIVVSPFGFLQANIRVYMSRHDVGAETMANYGDALKLIDSGGYQYLIVEIVGDALNYSDQVHFLNRFLQFCTIAAKEVNNELKIIVITPVSKDKFKQLFDVDVDFVVNKNDDWYHILNEIIHDVYEDTPVQKSGPSSIAAVNKALDALSEDEMLTLMEERMNEKQNQSNRLVHTELHETQQ